MRKRIGAEARIVTDTGLVKQSEQVRDDPVALSVTVARRRSRFPAEIQDAGSPKFKLLLMSSRFGLSCPFREGSTVTTFSELRLVHAPPARRPSQSGRAA